MPRFVTQNFPLPANCGPQNLQARMHSWNSLWHFLKLYFAKVYQKCPNPYFIKYFGKSLEFHATSR